jgi:heme-degrading monooxygenase HmoA
MRDGAAARTLLVVMNVVHVREERREAFERAFLGRESHVHKAEGFAGFELLRRDGERRVRGSLALERNRRL